MGKDAKQIGIDSEKKAAKKYKAKLTPNSGALWISKEDFFTTTKVLGMDGILFQNKYTDKQSFSLKLKDLKELESNATIDNRIPAFRIEYSTKGAFVLLPEWAFKLMIDKLINLE